MATKNRRVAAYLPPEIDRAFVNFKIERNLASIDDSRQNDSQALIQLLSEFFGVSQEVAHQGSSYITQQVEEFEKNLAAAKDELKKELRSELFSELRDELLKELKKRQDISKSSLPLELPSELKPIPQAPGQLELISHEEDVQELEKLDEKSSELKKELPSELPLVPLKARVLSQRLGCHPQVATNNKNSWKDRPEKFIQWSKSKDPNGIAWEYREDTKLYHPVFDSATPSDQVSPLPEGSERSGEG